jgi:signal transduction histidine kinase/CheY-like chemotaxis protein
VEGGLHFACVPVTPHAFSHPATKERLMKAASESPEPLPAVTLLGVDELRSVVENLPLGVLVTDDQDRCREANPAALQLLGYAKPQILGLTLADLSNIGARGATVRAGHGSPAAEHPGTRTTGMANFRTQSGASLVLDLTTYSHIRPGLHLLLLTDPKTKFRSEEERALSDGQWLHAQRLETLGRLASGIAHDFNNVLTAINGHVQLAAELLTDSSEARESLQLAHQAGQNARDLVRRILMFARDLPEPAPGLFDLAALVRETSGLISASLPSTLSLELDLPEAPAFVSADAGSLQHVIMNLCSLAAEAMDGRAGLLKVSVFPARGETGGDAHKPGFVSLVVSDTGRPLGLVFEGRDRTQASDPQSASGDRGRGLTVARRILARYGGQLRLHDPSGQGNRYEVYLPSPRGAVAESPGPAAESVVPRPAGERILVIDDEPSVCRYLELALRRARYQPEAYTSAAEGWARFMRSPADFQLLVVDLAMPEMGGLEIVQQSRLLRPGLPVLLMSGDLQQFDLSAVASHPEVTFLRKPVELHEFLSRTGQAIHAVPPRTA